MSFTIAARSGRARLGCLQLRRGTVATPTFMPVGTYGTVKAMTPEELHELGAEIVLGNTFHLMLRPGTDVIRAHGGLHGFMHWDHPILTHPKHIPAATSSTSASTPSSETKCTT